MASEKPEKQDIVVTVLGGCVTGVFTDISDVRLTILDWDNINAAPLESLSNIVDDSLPFTLEQMPNDTRMAFRYSIANRPSIAKA